MSASVVCLGEALIDFVPTESGLGLANTPAFLKAAGGAPANVAVGLARLGVNAAFLGMVGADPFGDFLADTLAGEGVDISPLRRTSESLTTLAFVSLTAAGEREFMFYRTPGADALLGPNDVDEAAVRACDLIHFGSITLIGERSRSGTLHAVEYARDSGRLVSYDGNLRLNLWPDVEAARRGLRLGLSRAHLVKLSEEELEFLAGHTDPSRAFESLGHNDLKALFLTAGSRGSYFVTPDFHGHVETPRVNPVDTTGAGDGFMAGLLTALLADRDALGDASRLADACRFANAVGALATTVRGGIPAMPTLTRVDELLAG